MIREGVRDCVLVVACDNVSEFVASGFSSLMALDKEMARPFDKNRRGLSLSEAAAFALLMSDARALREDRPVLAQISGWGLTSDANHITGPSRDGSGLALALRRALHSASGVPQLAGILLPEEQLVPDHLPLAFLHHVINKLLNRAIDG